MSVIVVSYKCLTFLRECLNSLVETGERLQILVVDNASDDGTVDALRREYPRITLIDNVENVGFPAANNQGLELAQAKNILLLNPDTVVTPGALEALLTFLGADGKPKVVGLLVCNMDGSPQHTVHLTLPGALRFAGEQVGVLNVPATILPNREGHSTEGAVRRVGWVSGAALAFNREVVAKIGNLDERMFWAEDLDFCYRAQKAGIPVYYLPTARILHYGGESGKKNYRRMIYAQHSSRVEFARKHFGGLSEAALRTAFAILLPLKMAFRIIQLPLPKVRAENRQRLAGYWDAWKFCIPGRTGSRKAN